MEKKKLNIYFIGPSPPIEYKDINISTIKECCSYLKDKDTISLDIETTRKFGGKYKLEGLDPYLSKIVMLQIGDKYKQFVIDYRCIDITSLLPILTNKNITIVGQNIKFEYKHILHNNKVRINNLYDTMIAEQILFNGMDLECSLDALNQRYLNIFVDKSTRLEFLTINDKPFTERQIIYGAQDILYPLLIRDKQLLDAENKDVLNCFSLEMLFTEVLGDIEYTGMHFDKTVWQSTYNKNLIEFKELEKKLDNYIFKYLPTSKFVNHQLDLFSIDKRTIISWTSSKQVVDLFNYLNICPQAISKSTKKLSYTVNAKVIRASLNTTNKGITDYKRELLLSYLKYKEKEQSCTTFGIKFFKHINPVTNRLHSNYKQIIHTGRVSSNMPNLQNIPAQEGFRSAFNCAEKYNIVNADYSGQETVILANVSKEPNIIKLILGGEDMHCFVVKALHPELAHLSDNNIKKYHKDKRQIAKAAGFAIQFGGTGITISENLGISLKRGEEVYNAYFKAFPELKQYFNKVQQKSRRQGYILIDPITGRKFWYKKPKSSKDWNVINRASLNYPVQGHASSITKLATILYRKWILDNNLQDFVKITNVVHDEVNIEVIEEYAELAAKHLEECMVKAGKKWCNKVPLKAEAVIGTFWNH